MARALTDRPAGLAGVQVPGEDHCLHTVSGVSLKVAQGHKVLLAVADGSGL